MSPRLLYLLNAEHGPSCERDRIGARTVAARMPGLRRPHWASIELATAA
jgi:hypothetical protein